MTTRTNRWIVAAALAALIACAAANGLLSVTAWGAGLASSEWPMFHRDALHTGRTDKTGPATPGTRWWQGGAAVTGEPGSGYTPHGPQGPIWSSAATSEVNATLGGAKKVWYFHDASWPTRATLVLRSEFPRGDSASVALNSAPGVVFETSAAMSFAAGSAAEYRNRDPYSNLIWLTLPSGTSQLRKRIPVGEWLFSLWVTGVTRTVPGEPVKAQVTVYQFPEGRPDVIIRQIAAGGVIRSGNEVAITTVAPHYFQVGDRVRVDGVAPASFDGLFVITSVPGANAFKYQQTGADETGGGGTVWEPMLGLGWDPATGDFDPITIPLLDAGSEPQLVTHAQPIAKPINLGLTDGVAIGITVSGGDATMLVGGSTPSRVETSIAAPAIYAGSDDGAVYAFDAATGNVLWSYAVADARFRSSPAVGDDGTVYIGSDGGEQDTLTEAGTIAYRTSIGSGADEIAVVVVSGTPYEMGYSYGRLMAAEVSACMTGYLAAAQAADPTRYSDAALDAAWATVEPYINSRFIDELHGVADGAGISYDTLRRAHAVTLVSNYACSLVGLWGAASANGDLYQIRNLDYAKDAGLQDHPVIVVYLPETGTAHANVAFAGFVGSVAGMNAEGIALSEKGETPQADYPFNLDGIPFFVMFRDILQDAVSLDEALNIVSTDQRIKKYFYAVGDGGAPPAARAARKLRAFAPNLDIWTDNDPTDNLAPNVLPNVVYQTMNNAAAWTHLNANYGNYDPALMVALSRLVASAGGNLMNVVYDATSLEMWVAYAEGAADASTRPYVYFNLNNYLAAKGPVYALRPNGTIKWVSEDVPGAVSASPIISSDDVAYVATHRGEVHALEAASGEQRWVTTLSEGGVADELRSSPAYDSATGTVYVGSMNGRLYALDGYSGGILWRYPASGQPALGAIESSPALFSDSIQWYFVNEPATEDPSRMHFSSTLHGDDGADPTADISRAIANSGGGPATLDEKFDQEFRTHPQSAEPGMPLLLPSGTYSMNFWARAEGLQGTDTAAVYFKVFVSASATPILTFPAQQVADSQDAQRYHSYAQLAAPVTLGGTDYLRVEVWGQATLAGGNSATVHFDFDGQLMSSLDAMRDRVYFGSDDGNVYCVQPVLTAANTIEPQLQWSFATGDAVTATPAIGSDGTVYVGSRDHNMYALTPDGVLAPGWPYVTDGEIQSSAALARSGNTTLIYFATSVRRDPGPPAKNVAVGRVYCLDKNGQVIWHDALGNDGYDPRANDPTPTPTAFTTSPALWQVESVWGTVVNLNTFEFTNVTRTQEPVLFLGGQDSVMYALGPVLGAISPPVIVPPQKPPQTALRLSKTADRQVAYQDAGGDIYITFALRYRNESTVLADPVLNVQVVDPIPTAVDYQGVPQPGAITITVYSPGGVKTAAGMSWNVGTVWPQDSGQVWFTVKVTGNLAGLPSSPQVVLSRTDPVPPGAVTAPLLTDFVWGQVLYIRLTGRGRPGKVTNSPAADPAGIYSGLVPMAYAAAVIVDVGWGDRYRLKFIYDELVPGNQAVTYATDIVLGASGTRTGRAEEAYQNLLVLGADETVFKVQLSPRGYAPGASAYAITALPNRPWTPYYWKLQVDQMVGGSPGNEIWYTLRPASPDHAVGDADFQIHNPLSVTGPSASNPYILYVNPLDVADRPIPVNPGTQTAGYYFTVQNTGLQPLTGSGSTTPRGVVRWGKVDLGHQGTAYPYYNPRDENYLPENAIHTEPDYLSLGPGQSRSVKVWGDLPAHLSPGVYQAPNAGPDTFDMPIYADLNGNDVWDPGEAKFEYEVGGVSYPFTIASVVSTQPLIGFGSQMMDLGKLPTGVNTANAADQLLLGASGQLPQVPVRNLGNVDFRSGTLGGITLGPASVAPPWGLPPVGLDVYKPPVGALRPSQGTVSIGGLPLQYDAPTGAYSGAGVAESITTDPGAPIPNVVARDVSPFRVRAVERRLTGYESDGQPVPGADLEPWATWIDVGTLRLAWSSDTRADGATPGPSDPYRIWHTTFHRSAGTWDPAQSYPAIGADPMDLPTSNWITKAHVTPGHAVDGGATRAEWLFWGGSDLRPGAGGGYAYDNRLLWTGVPTAAWPPTAADAIGDYPDVATGGQPVTDLFRLQPRPVFWTAGGVEHNYVVLSQHSSSLPWQLALRYRSRNPANSWAGNPWLDGWVEKVEPVEIHIRPDQAPIQADAASGLVAARDPSVALDRRPDPATGLINAGLYQGYLWVAFSGVSGYHGNWDIYLARYNPTPDALTGKLSKAPFARISGEPLSPDASRTVFASRHKVWQLSAPPQTTDLKIYVAGADIGGTGVSAPDAEGWRVLQGTSLGNVDFHPGLGLVRFAGSVAGSVRLDYTPQLLRLTTAAANESNPALIIETYRYRDAGGNLLPAGYRHRLWVFWVQEGVATGAAEIMYETMRESAPLAGDWQPEHAAGRVVVDHAANEFGLSAVKDPAYPQVWLFWSSTRGAPTGQPAPPAAADSDLYYQAFAPELP